MSCLVADILQSALEANTQESYKKALVALNALSAKDGLCTSHLNIVAHLLASSGEPKFFLQALKDHAALVRMQSFFTNFNKTLEEGGDFIQEVLEAFPGEAAMLADRIFVAAGTDSKAKELVDKFSSKDW